MGCPNGREITGGQAMAANEVTGQLLRIMLLYVLTSTALFGN
jgi:hypothetical protein